MAITTLSSIAQEMGHGRGLYRVLIFDREGSLADAPEGFIESIELTDALNGGSGSCTIVFTRPYNNWGRLEYGYTALIWIWNNANAMPDEPYYSGTVIDIDQDQGNNSGRITAYFQGDFKLLDAAIVTSEITQGNDGTQLPTADAYLGAMLPVYMPPGWGTPDIPPMYQLLPVKFDGTLLGSVIDTIVKQSRDANGGLMIWYTRIRGNLERYIVIRPDPNPTLARPYPIYAGDFRDFHIATTYADIINTIAVYGGKNPRTGKQVYGVFYDELSATQYGAKQEKISVSYLLDDDGARRYAETYFALHGFPTSTASLTLFLPRPEIRAGVWVEIKETPEYAGPGSGVIKQMRVAEVKVKIDASGNVTQSISTNSPAPFLDGALYQMGNAVAATQGVLSRPLALNKQKLYIRSGGEVNFADMNPARVSIAQTDAVFPTTGLVSIVPWTMEVRDSYQAHLIGDGDYMLFAEATMPTYVCVKGDVPENDVMQLLARICVIDGIPYVSDERTLIATPSLNIAKVPVPGGDAYLPAPIGGGSVGAYSQQVIFQLDEGGSASTPGLAAVRLFTRPVVGALMRAGQVLLDRAGNVVYAEADQPLAGAVDSVPTRDGKYDMVIPAIGAGLMVAIYVAYVDTQGRISAPLYLATTSENGLPQYISYEDLKEVADKANEAVDTANAAYDQAVATDLPPLIVNDTKEVQMPPGAVGYTANPYYMYNPTYAGDEGGVITFAMRWTGLGGAPGNFRVVFLAAPNRTRAENSIDVAFVENDDGGTNVSIFKWSNSTYVYIGGANFAWGLFNSGSYHTVQVVVKGNSGTGGYKYFVHIAGQLVAEATDNGAIQATGFVGLENHGARHITVQNFTLKTRGESYDAIAGQIGDTIGREPAGGSGIKEGQIGRPQIDSGGSSGGGGNLLFNPTGVKGIEGWTPFGNPHPPSFYTDPFGGGRFVLHDVHGQNNWTLFQQAVNGIFTNYSLCVSAQLQANGCRGSVFVELTDPWGNIIARSTQIVQDGAAMVSVSAVGALATGTNGGCYVRCGTNTPGGQVVGYRLKLEYGTRPSPWTDDFADSISDKAHDRDGILNFNNSPEGLKNRHSLMVSCDGKMPYVSGNILVIPSTVIVFRTNGTYCRIPPSQYVIGGWDYIFMMWQTNGATPWIVAKPYAATDFNAWSTSPDWEIIGIINADRGLRFEAFWVESNHFSAVQSEIDEAGRYNVNNTQPGTQLPWANNYPWVLNGLGSNGGYPGILVTAGTWPGGDTNENILGVVQMWIPAPGSYRVMAWWSAGGVDCQWYCDHAGGNVWGSWGVGGNNRKGGPCPTKVFNFYATGGQTIGIAMRCQGTGSNRRNDGGDMMLTAIRVN